jgi:hypothetical protein
MPATAPEFTRRALLLAALAASLRADSADQVWDVIGAMAAALSNTMGAEFLGFFDRAMPGLPELRVNVTGLLTQLKIESSIDLVSNEGDDQKRTVEVDWLLRMRNRDDDSVSDATRREERVKFRFAKQGKRWRIVSLEPLSFFAVPQSK